MLAIAALLACAWLSACGQTGALYLPTETHTEEPAAAMPGSDSAQQEERRENRPQKNPQPPQAGNVQ